MRAWSCCLCRPGPGAFVSTCTPAAAQPPPKPGPSERGDGAAWAQLEALWSNIPPARGNLWLTGAVVQMLGKTDLPPDAEALLTS